MIEWYSLQMLIYVGLSNNYNEVLSIQFQLLQDIFLFSFTLDVLANPKWFYPGAQLWLRCAQPFLRCREKETQGGVQTVHPPSRARVNTYLFNSLLYEKQQSNT